jgi:hypothetical protein
MLHLTYPDTRDMFQASLRGPRAVFGDLLWGDRAVRFVFMDEAGTSEDEPVTVVVGIIVNADEQLLHAELAVEEALGAIPEEFKQDGFHADDIWNNHKYRERWSQTDRMTLVKTMASLPRRLNLAISYAIERRSSVYTEHIRENYGSVGLDTTAKLNHFFAFINCIGRADKYIRDHCNHREVGTVIAEDIPDMRRFLKLAPRLLRDCPIIPRPGDLMPTAAERAQGYITQEGEQRVNKIRNSMLFAEKDEDPMLQIADACAFSLRRYFSELEFGRDLIRAVRGNEPNMDDFMGPASIGTWFWHADRF